MPLSLPLRVIDRQGSRPKISEESEPYWEAAARGELMVEECGGCGLHIFPPRGICRRCHRRDLHWTHVTAPGVLASFTINQHQWAEDTESEYGIGLVEFPEFSNVRFVGFLDGFDDTPQIEALVNFAFAPSAKGIHRIYFTPWEKP